MDWHGRKGTQTSVLAAISSISPDMKMPNMRILRHSWEVPRCGPHLFQTRSWSRWDNDSKAAIAEVQIWSRWQRGVVKLSWPTLAFCLSKTRPSLQSILSHFLQDFLHKSISSSLKSLLSHSLFPLSYLLQSCPSLKGHPISVLPYSQATVPRVIHSCCTEEWGCNLAFTPVSWGSSLIIVSSKLASDYYDSFLELRVV